MHSGPHAAVILSSRLMAQELFAQQSEGSSAGLSWREADENISGVGGGGETERENWFPG